MDDTRENAGSDQKKLKVWELIVFLVLVLFVIAGILSLVL